MTDSERDFSWLKLRRRKRLPLRLGVKATGELEVLDLATVHALLLTGPTGCGKSVAVHTLIDSMMSAKTPKDFKLLLIDGKEIEFTDYGEDLPFLLALPVARPAKIRAAIQWLSREVEKRNVRHVRAWDAPEIVVAIDGMVFAWDALAEIEDEFWHSVGQGMSAGVHFIVTSQNAGFAKGHETSFPCHLKMTGTGRMRGTYDGREIDVTGEDLGDETLANVYGRYRTAEPSLVDFVNGEILEARRTAWAEERRAKVEASAKEAARMAEEARREAAHREIDDNVRKAMLLIARTYHVSTAHFRLNLGWDFGLALDIFNRIKDMGVFRSQGIMAEGVILWSPEQFLEYLKGEHDEQTHD